MFVEGDKIAVKVKKSVGKDLYFKTGKILSWHHDDVYTVLIEDKEYVLFGTEMEKVVNNDKS